MPINRQVQRQVDTHTHTRRQIDAYVQACICTHYMYSYKLSSSFVVILSCLFYFKCEFKLASYVLCSEYIIVMTLSMKLNLMS